jgi:hypothetical protein
LSDDKNSGCDAVHNDNVFVFCDGNPRHYIDILNVNLFEKLSIFGENLHARPFVTTVANDVAALASQQSHFAGMPQVTVVTPSHSKLRLETASFVKNLDNAKSNHNRTATKRITKTLQDSRPVVYLNSVVATVGNDDIFVKT